MNLTGLFDRSLRARRDEVGLEWQGRAYTFGEIDQRAKSMAQVLARRGLAAGDRLCVYLPNSIAVIDLYLACVKLGVIFVPINILYKEREIAHILGDAQPKGIVAAGEFPAPVWTPAELNAEAGAASHEPPPVVLGDDAPAAIVYTSGTTGASKGAVLTHGNFAANAITLLQAWRIASTDRLLLPLPLFHVHGLGNGLHCWLASGCRMRLLERFDHTRAAAEFLDFRPSLFFGVPTIYVRLLEQAPEAARQIGAGMRLFVSGSAPLPPQVLEEFRERFGHVILERYGMTETLMNTGNPYDGERRPGSVGLPLPGVSVRIVDSEGNPAGDGETGEIELRGPNVFAGYWRRPEATVSAFRGGPDGKWFRTGDLATRSTDGYYTLVARRSDVIISGGFNIYPREIEEFLLEQPGVAEAAVVGRPDSLRGEIPIAYVAGSFDPAALGTACREHLASFKAPREFIRVDALPRTALGKVQKHLLPPLQ